MSIDLSQSVQHNGYQSNLPCYDLVATRSNNAFPEHWQPTQSFLEEIPEVGPSQADNQRRIHDSDPLFQHAECFIKSLFPKVPPYLKFNLHGTKVRPLPSLFRRRLRFKTSNVIPK
ncbi:unnamed protein product, partial [Rodentolepis nana]|uniref:Uncharacterized protein n=1 Tax=Rodentolepis nana TaxID=102285 RepID=A0A0R3TIM7_RODNA